MPAYRVQSDIRVFIASPGDLTQERKLAEKVFRDINETFLRSRNARIVQVKVSSDTYTKVTGKDPQFVINEQILDRFDAILVMFWGRVGTETPRAISGTVEELERAFKRYKKTLRPHIMCYFKTAGIDPLSMGVKQLADLQEVYKTVLKQGLIFKFAKSEQFVEKLRSDMMNWLEAEVLKQPEPIRVRPNLSSFDLLQIQGARRKPARASKA